MPEKFEFNPVNKNVNIKKEKENKEQYMDLLLEADPSENMINKYLKDGELFVLTYKDEVAGIAVVLEMDKDAYLVDNYKTRYKKIIVGTTENNIPFYVKQGFDKYEKTVKDFFIDNYDEKIKDGDLICTDLIYYSKDLKKK